jgi:hypothetical protein
LILKNKTRLKIPTAYKTLTYIAEASVTTEKSLIAKMPGMFKFYGWFKIQPKLFYTKTNFSGSKHLPIRLVRICSTSA